MDPFDRARAIVKQAMAMSDAHQGYRNPETPNTEPLHTLIWSSGPRFDSCLITTGLAQAGLHGVVLN
jgi:hypothetical protein